MSYYEKGKMHIMPIVFGPGGTPRETNKGSRFIYEQPEGTKIFSHKIVYETNAKMLEKLLPDNFSLTHPYIILSFNQLRDIGWLAGNGYDLIQVEIPVCFNGNDGKVNGTFMPVVWENHADPILTGREQLGWSKIYADMKTPEENKGIITASASSWGFTFLDVSLDTNREAQNPDEFELVTSNPDNQGMMHLKYFPKTGDDFAEADVNYVTLSPAKWDAPVDFDNTLVPKPSKKVCWGEASWHRPEWEQMPTQSHIIQKLYDLEVIRFVGGCKTEFNAPNDRRNQRIIR